MNLYTVDLDEVEVNFVGFVKKQLNVVERSFISKETAGTLITGYFDGISALVSMNSRMLDLLDLSREALYGDTTQKEKALKYFK